MDSLIAKFCSYLVGAKPMSQAELQGFWLMMFSDWQVKKATVN